MNLSVALRTFTVFSKEHPSSPSSSMRPSSQWSLLPKYLFSSPVPLSKQTSPESFLNVPSIALHASQVIFINTSNLLFFLKGGRHPPERMSLSVPSPSLLSLLHSCQIGPDRWVTFLALQGPGQSLLSLRGKNSAPGSFLAVRPQGECL